MAQNYIGVNGLVTQTISEIQADLTQKYKNIYGENINIEQNSSDGQLINIEALQKKDILDLITQFYNNLDPDYVIGLPQQTLYKLNGLTIKKYTYSYTYVNVTVTEAATLQGLDENIENADGTGYTVSDVNGNRWILAETQNLTDAGTYLLNFRAAELGSITALPNTITIKETVIKGVSSVNNPANNYITGQTGETSAQFRQRRHQSMAAPSQGFKDSIQSQMLELTNVNQCKVYENKTNVTANGIPPHTVWVITEGGTSAEIGQVIYANVPPGIPMKGDISVQVIRPSGDFETVYYDTASAVPLYVRAAVKNLSQYPLDTDYIINQLALMEFTIQQTVTTSMISNNISNTIGETGAVYDIEISADGSSWAEYLTPSGLDEYFSITSENVSLTEE